MASLLLGLLCCSHQPAGRSPDDVLAATVELATAASEEAYQSLWVTEHHGVCFSLTPSALMTAAYLLGCTESLRVGTAVTLVPLNPLPLVIEQASLLHRLSGGRFNLGVGKSPFSFVSRNNHQVSLSANSGVLEEVVDALVEAKDAGSLTVDGGDRLNIVPAPPKSLPIYVASESESARDRAAVLGLPLLLHWRLTTSQRRDRLVRYAGIAEQNGHRSDSIDHVVTAIGSVTSSNAEITTLENRLSHWLASASSARPGAVADATHRRNARELVSSGAVGSAEVCAQWLRDNATSLGVHHVALLLEFADDVFAQLGHFRSIADAA